MAFGTNLLGLAMLDRAKRDANDHACYLAGAKGEAEGTANKYVFVARSHVHCLRAGLHARRVAEDELMIYPRVARCVKWRARSVTRTAICGAFIGGIASCPSPRSASSAGIAAAATRMRSSCSSDSRRQRRL